MRCYHPSHKSADSSLQTRCQSQRGRLHTRADRQLHLALSMSTFVTSANADRVPKSFNKYCESLEGPGTPWTIEVRSAIEADVYRLYQMLTTPEYLEAWISLPGDGARSSHVVGWKETNGFRLDHYRHGTRDMIIQGEYYTCRRHKLVFTWKVTGEFRPPESVVFIRLCGNFSTTIMELYHSGCSHPAYHSWQRQMWESSICRLAGLCRGTNVHVDELLKTER
jgi:uncharacterized protein YndB with AHSA1/START domain